MSRRSAWTLALAMLAAAGAAPGGAAGPGASATGGDDPAALFTKICLGDEVKLSKQDFAPIAYSKLPAGAKTALGFSLPDASPGAVVMLTPMPEPDVPNQVLVVLPKKNAYLLLPAHGSEGRLAPHCLMVWRGNHFDEALAAAKSIPSLKVLSDRVWSNRGVPGTNFVSVQSQGVIAGAAEYSGWTVLRIAPDTTPQEQTIQ